jgi:hypothetical protein
VKTIENKSNWAFRIGLFIIALTWLFFSIYQSGKSIFNFDPELAFTDLPGSIGLGFRTVAAFVALVTILIFLVKRDLSKLELLTNFRWILLFEAVYWLVFLPSGIWGFQYSGVQYSHEFFIIETGLPCIVQGLIMPPVLVMLFFKLSPKRPAKGAIKWGLIAAVAQILVFWFNYTSQWWSEIYLDGTKFLTQYPMYALEFAGTVGGLLLLAVYAILYARRMSGVESLDGLDLRHAGFIITLLGLYFDIIVLLWLLFGNVGTLTVWPTISVDHNLNLWLVSLPLVGLPLIFSKKQKPFHKTIEIIGKRVTCLFWKTWT